MDHQLREVLGCDPNPATDPTEQEVFAYSLSIGKYVVEQERDLKFRVGRVVVPNMDKKERNDVIQKNVVYNDYATKTMKNREDGACTRARRVQRTST